MGFNGWVTSVKKRGCLVEVKLGEAETINQYPSLPAFQPSSLPKVIEFVSQLKILLILALILVVLSTACQPSPANPTAAQKEMEHTWQTAHHIVWEIEWTAMPIGGMVVAEVWRTDTQHRFEILESPAPALVGEMLIFDGQQAWQYNRFKADTPTPINHPWLSPISDAYIIIDQLLTQAAQDGTQADASLSQGAATLTTLNFPNGEILSIWQDQETGLPARVHFKIGENEATLNARSIESLVNPPEGLFKPN